MSRKSVGKQPARVGRQLVAAFEDLNTALNLLIRKPFKNLSRFKSGTTATRRESSRNKPSGSARIIRLVEFPVSLFGAVVSLALKVVLSPIDVLVAFKKRPKSLKWSIPCLLILIAILMVTFRFRSQSATIQLARTTANDAFERSDFQTAIDQYSLLQSMDQPLTAQEAFQLATSLIGNNQSEQARELIDRLAPGPGHSTGYAPAHELKAIAIAAAMPKPMQPEPGQLLRWHLDASGDSNDPLLHHAWAEYYLGVKDPLSAAHHMERAAASRPERMLDAAEIYRSLGDRSSYDRVIQSARNRFQQALDQDPAQVSTRISLSQVLSRLGQLDQAERVLMQHPGSAPEELRRARAEHYLRRYAIASNPSGVNDSRASDFEARFHLLQQALQHDLNHLATYQAMIRLYLEIRDTPAADQVVESLQRTIHDQRSGGLAHFALSNILWVNGDKAQAKQQMELAFQESPRQLVFVANNLAWILAEGDEPDLDRAHELARHVVNQFPNDGRLRDTLATVLMKQQRYDQALAEFKRALPTVSKQADVHTKIAQIYERMSKPQLADMHRRRAHVSVQN